MDDYKVQLSKKIKIGVDEYMINSRGENAEEVWAQYQEMRDYVADEVKALKSSEKAELADRKEGELPFYNEGDTCPKCKQGKLKKKQGTSKTTGKFYSFVGCDNYPNCDYVVK